MLQKINEKLKNSKGQSMLEYILIVVFVVVTGLAVWKAFGKQIKNLVSNSTAAISNQTSDVFQNNKP